jgi:FkbM family methyltransferase
MTGIGQWWDGKAQGLRSLRRIAPGLREPLRFSLRQVTRRTGIGRYHLRGSDVVILVRHSTGDLITLEEVLAERQYEPPAQLASLFARNGAPLHVADVGANIGLFSAWVLSRRPDAQIVAFEPDPDNADVLEDCMRANGGRAQIVRAAAAPRAGQLRFQAGELAASRQVDEGGIAVPAVDVFPYLEQADFVKLDIEGGEWELLADPRFAGLPARALVVEYHPHLCPAPDPRVHAEALLTAAGFALQHMDFAMPPGHGVLWAWRPAADSASP